MIAITDELQWSVSLLGSRQVLNACLLKYARDESLRKDQSLLKHREGKAICTVASAWLSFTPLASLLCAKRPTWAVTSLSS